MNPALNGRHHGVNNAHCFGNVLAIRESAVMHSLLLKLYVAVLAGEGEKLVAELQRWLPVVLPPLVKEAKAAPFLLGGRGNGLRIRCGITLGGVVLIGCLRNLALFRITAKNQWQWNGENKHGGKFFGYLGSAL